VSGEALYRALKKRGHVDVRFVPHKNELVTALLEVVQSGDVVLTLGAGDIYRTGVDLLSRLRNGGACVSRAVRPICIPLRRTGALCAAARALYVVPDWRPG
jgi:UDP-N-acetylmuramate--alanine ligase